MSIRSGKGAISTHDKGGEPVSVEVEGWLRRLKTAAGKPASPGTQTKIRNLLSAMFSYAIRYDANPRITMAIYQQAVSAEKRVAQDRLVAGLIPTGVLEHLSAPAKRE